MSTELALVKKATSRLASMVGSPDTSLAPLLAPSLLHVYTSFAKCGHARRFELSVVAKPESLAEEALDDGEGGGRVSRGARLSGEGAELALLLDLLGSGSERTLRLRFELSSASGGVRVRVEEGDEAVLQSVVGQAEEEGAEAVPRWLRTISEGVDSGAAAAVLTSLWAALDTGVAQMQS
jgi:hypothetical protein